MLSLHPSSSSNVQFLWNQDPLNQSLCPKWLPLADSTLTTTHLSKALNDKATIQIKSVEQGDLTSQSGTILATRLSIKAEHKMDKDGRFNGLAFIQASTSSPTSFYSRMRYNWIKNQEHVNAAMSFEQQAGGNQSAACEIAARAQLGGDGRYSGVYAKFVRPLAWKNGIPIETTKVGTCVTLVPDWRGFSAHGFLLGENGKSTIIGTHFAPSLTSLTNGPVNTLATVQCGIQDKQWKVGVVHKMKSTGYSFAGIVEGGLNGQCQLALSGLQVAVLGRKPVCQIQLRESVRAGGLTHSKSNGWHDASWIRHRERYNAISIC